jgi:hypothetical protein
LENWNPNYTSYSFYWIPKGLFEDLIDDTPGEIFVNDKVSGFTISQEFAALQNDVMTLQQYEMKLKSQNPNTQANPNLSTQITNLFTSYNY